MITLDIETIPNPNMLDKLPEPDVKYGNTKDEEKRAKIYEEAKRKQREDMALSPFTGMICAFALHDDKMFYDRTGYLSEISTDKERDLICTIFDHICPDKPGTPKICTFNGFLFDLPYIYKRAMMHGIMAPYLKLNFWCQRYKSTTHIDLRMVLSNWNFQAHGSLDYYCKMILGESKPEIGYEHYQSLIKAGEGKKIADECLEHVKLTYRLYEKIKPYLL